MDDLALASAIRSARSEKGLSQQALAERIHVSRQAVAKWESGRGVPDLANLCSLCRELGLSLDALLSTAADHPALETRRVPENLVVAAPARSRGDAAVVAMFAEADVRQPLIRTRALTGLRWWLDFLTFPGVVSAADSFADNTSSYRVEQDGRALLVEVSGDVVLSTQWVHPARRWGGWRGDGWVLRRSAYSL